MGVEFTVRIQLRLAGHIASIREQRLQQYTCPASWHRSSCRAGFCVEPQKTAPGNLRPIMMSHLVLQYAERGFCSDCSWDAFSSFSLARPACWSTRGDASLLMLASSRLEFRLSSPLLVLGEIVVEFGRGAAEPRGRKRPPTMLRRLQRQTYLILSCFLRQ